MASPRCAVANPVTLVRNMGVASMPLIGGRYDGGSWVAVVGCPVCIPVKPAKKKPKEDAVTGRSIFMTYWSTSPVEQEGDEWKGGNTKDAPENRTTRFAIYAPQMQDGKASLALYFVEEIDKC